MHEIRWAAQMREFVFNGDNKQSQGKDASNNVVGTYFYDGEGHRVKKVTQTETVVYVYSNGRQIAEYSTATPAANPTTNYTATDMLGSPRVLTDSLGNVVSRRDFLPFGEELYADGVHRTLAGKYSQTGQDGVRQRFTGYEKDAETSLDFAEAIILGFSRLCLSICGEALLHRLRRFSICGFAAGGRATLFIGVGVRKSRTFPQIERQSRFLAEGQKLRWPKQSKIALSGRSKRLRNQLNTAISRQLSAGSSQLRQCPY
ncbi:MAG: hypothetical protein K1X52_05605 [Pyrinomonadaceae bacterium]|nr:hypothetical protein [Pyrinomonadaceae bacterium]